MISASKSNLRPGRRIGLTVVGLAVLVAGIGMTSARLRAEAASGGHDMRTESRTPYIHKIPLMDEDGKAIDPKEKDAKPYSPRTTCGKCHDYAVISHGLHFNAFEGGPAGRPGQTWFLTDPVTGTQLPVGYRDWPGVTRPEVLGLTPWKFVKTFGRHMPGGGPGELAKEAIDKSPEKTRWSIAGKLEIDCLVCHTADLGYDNQERKMQLQAENLKWIPSVTSGLGMVRGKAADVKEAADPDMPADFEAAAKLPKLLYDKNRFDQNDAAFLPITRNISQNRCYFCHSFRSVGSGAPARSEHDRDVHMKAGMNCVDCHRNGINHMMVRGYENEKIGDSKSAISSLSCRGCHLGQDGCKIPVTSKGGRMGAPVPRHKGLPGLHFEKLTCTACHSGPYPSASPLQSQTSQANGLGVVAAGYPADTLPLIAEPVFVGQPDGKIGVHRMMWPAYYGRLNKDNSVTPLSPDAVTAAAKEAFAAKAEEGKPAAGLEPKAKVAKALELLAAVKDAQGEPVYVTGGKMYRLAAGKLTAADNATLKPYSWAIAHEVRPAKFALGAGACTDCHSVGAPLFDGKVAPLTPVVLEEIKARSMAQIAGLGDEEAYFQLFNQSFAVRPLMKCTCLTASLIITLILILYGFRGLAVCLQAAGKPKKSE